MISNIPWNPASVPGNEDLILQMVKPERPERTSHTTSLLLVNAPNVCPHEKHLSTVDKDSVLHETEKSSGSDEIYSLEGLFSKE